MVSIVHFFAMLVIFLCGLSVSVGLAEMIYATSQIAKEKAARSVFPLTWIVIWLVLLLVYTSTLAK